MVRTMLAPVTPRSQMEPSSMVSAAGTTVWVMYSRSGVEVAMRKWLWRKVRNRGLRRKSLCWLRKVRMASGRKGRKGKVGGALGRGGGVWV